MNGKTILAIVAKTNAGRLRKLNEDRYVISNDIGGSDWRVPIGPYNNAGAGSIMAIADGKGQSDTGRIASGIAIENLQKYFYEPTDTGEQNGNIPALLKSAIISCHHAVAEHSTNHPETKGMETTLIISWIVNDSLYVSWSGNSSCYHYRPGTGLKQLSRNSDAAKSSVPGAKMPEPGPLRKLGNHEMPPQPGIARTWLAKNDLVIMCSNGLNLMLTEEEIEKIVVLNSADINACTDVLIASANAAGGMDNITIIVAKIIELASIEKAGDIVSRKTDPMSSKNKLSEIKKTVPVLSIILLFLVLSAGMAPFLISLDTVNTVDSSYNLKNRQESGSGGGKKDGQLKKQFKNDSRRNPYNETRPDSSDSSRPALIPFRNKASRAMAENGATILQKGSFIRANINADAKVK